MSQVKKIWIEPEPLDVSMIVSHLKQSVLDGWYYGNRVQFVNRRDKLIETMTMAPDSNDNEDRLREDDGDDCEDGYKYASIPTEPSGVSGTTVQYCTFNTGVQLPPVDKEAIIALAAAAEAVRVENLQDWAAELEGICDNV